MLNHVARLLNFILEQIKSNFNPNTFIILDVWYKINLNSMN
jgi:hypothetical protein